MTTEPFRTTNNIVLAVFADIQMGQVSHLGRLWCIYVVDCNRMGPNYPTYICQLARRIYYITTRVASVPQAIRISFMLYNTYLCFLGVGSDYSG
jgi:hypothetical protein